MPQFNDLNSLFKFVKEEAQATLKDEVAKAAIDEMSTTILEETYPAYRSEAKNPYIRRGLHDGLADKSNISVEIIDDNTISIENLTTGNTRYPGSTSGAIDGLIVRGTGYTWRESAIYRLQPFPRDFYAGTVARLTKNKKHIAAFREGMRKRGIVVN
jgi:hypothetical protein